MRDGEELVKEASVRSGVRDETDRMTPKIDVCFWIAGWH